MKNDDTDNLKLEWQRRLECLRLEGDLSLDQLSNEQLTDSEWIELQSLVQSDPQFLSDSHSETEKQWHDRLEVARVNETVLRRLILGADVSEPAGDGDLNRASELALCERIKDAVAQAEVVNDQKREPESGQPESGQSSEQDDYQTWFGELDDHRAQMLREGVADQKVTPANGARRWFLVSGGVVATIVTTVLLFLFFRTGLPEQADVISAEQLCQNSLDWNPETLGGQWNEEVQQAPADRRFPAHLIRFRAQAWKTVAVEGDEQAVVYDLIPQDDLGSLKAYVYVLKPSQEYELPQQFDLIPDASYRYQFWSVACQQDLVYILVFEGDNHRTRDLIIQQEIG